MLCVFCIHDNEMCICLFLVFSILSHLTVAGPGFVLLFVKSCLSMNLSTRGDPLSHWVVYSIPCLSSSYLSFPSPIYFCLFFSHPISFSPSSILMHPFGTHLVLSYRSYHISCYLVLPTHTPKMMAPMRMAQEGRAPTSRISLTTVLQGFNPDWSNMIFPSTQI